MCLRDYGNDLKETFCSMRLKENIDDPSRADIFTPQAGRINTVNSFNMLILRHLRLSAERGVLYNGLAEKSSFPTTSRTRITNPSATNRSRIPNDIELCSF
ncbi:Legumin A [Morus notabilis]|uniref:Legumin A n=1 Tax=Morus notabilis TaxID=981085 RepID=W9R8V7_9ROSA|nr:Legumin A [Morus notabilis]